MRASLIFPRLFLGIGLFANTLMGDELQNIGVPNKLESKGSKGLSDAPASSGQTAGEHYLFTSFRGNGEDGLHLAHSQNGYQWTALNGDRSYLKPEIGKFKLMRDPCLVQGPDGLFHMVWTAGWTTEGGSVMGYASSIDLKQWSAQRAIEVMKKEPSARNVWAPELFYDAHRSQWIIFWSSTIPGRFPQSDTSGDDQYNHRVYYTTTRDFAVFTETRLMFNPDFNVIDATLLKTDNRYYLIFKDERKNPVKKNLRYSIAENPLGPYGVPSEPFTGDWVEGPSALKIGDVYFVYFDHYARPQYYGAVRSKDLVHWEDCSKEMIFPVGHRHGSVLRITAEIAHGLLKK